MENLRIPWELVFLSEEKAPVTERAGRIRLVENGLLHEKSYKVIDEVEHIGKGELMGLAKHPDYPDQKYLYIMHTYRETMQSLTGLPVISIPVLARNLTRSS